MANKKKSIRLRNTTNYFDPEVTRTYNTFSSPSSYMSRQQKIEGYETRLYWQYRYCDEHDGQTFFYTLTYNDEHIPTQVYFRKTYPIYGDDFDPETGEVLKIDEEVIEKRMNCFDYEDLRDLLTGGFRKQLLRKYGTTFKYFVGAELGDGKGTRGLANNPHYHALFFLENAHNPRYPYKKIDPKEFRHLVRTYWQGFDEDETGFQDYRTAKYGIAREGENDGLVTDFRACMYCAKYVTKDVKLKRAEKGIYHVLTEDVFNEYRNSEEAYAAFFHEYLRPQYDVDSAVTYTDREFAKYLYDDNSTFELKHRIAHGGSILAPYYEGLDKYAWFMPKVIERLQCGIEYIHFLHQWIVPKVNDRMKEYRNRYCNKCRISQGVGDYALKQSNFDKFAGTIQVPAKEGWKDRPISMYYYRRLFNDVITVTDELGNKSPRYILNADGVRYKCSRLPKQIEKKAEVTASYLNMLMNNSYLYDRMIHSDVNTQIFTPHAEFLDYVNYLLNENNITNISTTYAAYKLIYEDRYFPYNSMGMDSVSVFPPLQYEHDYCRFLSSIVYRRNAYRLTAFFEDGNQGYLPYSSHPDFLRYSFLFTVLDTCADYFFVQGDDRKQKEAEDRAATKRFHDCRKLNEFYSRFCN